MQSLELVSAARAELGFQVCRALSWAYPKVETKATVTFELRDNVVREY